MTRNQSSSYMEINPTSTDQTIIHSKIDLSIFLIGDNKLVSTGDEHVVLISVADYYNAKDLYIYGSGEIEALGHLYDKSAESFP